MRRRLTALGLVVAVVALAACSPAGARVPSPTTTGPVDFTATPTGELSAWGFENADDVGKARLAYAADQLGHVDIEVDATAFDAQKFSARLTAGDVPDVVQMDRRFVAQYAAQKLIMPLDACFKLRSVTPDEYWYPSVVDDVRYHDQIWAVPQFSQPLAIILNKTVMDDVGVTDDQIDTSKPAVLLDAIARMYVPSGTPSARLGFDPVATGQAALWVIAQGGKLTDEDGRPTLDDPANRAGVALLKRIMDVQGGFAAVRTFADSFDTFGDNNQFVTDQVGSQVNAQWYPGVLAPYADKIDVEATPFKTADGQPISVAGGSAFVIPVGAKNPAAACAWMIDITDEDAWMAGAAARADTVTSDDEINTGLFTGSPGPDQKIRQKYVVATGDTGFDQMIATYYDVVAHGTSVGSSPVAQDIQNELGDAVTAALLGQKTIPQALQDAQKAAMRAYDAAVAGH